MDNALVILVVILAFVYGIRVFYMRLKTQQICCCRCSICTLKASLGK